MQVHALVYREKAKGLPLLSLADPGAAVEAALSQPKVVAASQRIETSGMVSSREGYVRLSVAAPTVRIRAAMERLHRFQTSPTVAPGA